MCCNNSWSKKHYIVIKLWFTYHKTSDFFHYITNAPNVEIICEYFAKKPIVVLLIYARQYKTTKHDHQNKKGYLEKNHHDHINNIYQY